MLPAPMRSWTAIVKPRFQRKEKVPSPLRTKENLFGISCKVGIYRTTRVKVLPVEVPPWGVLLPGTSLGLRGQTRKIEGVEVYLHHGNTQY